MTDTHLFANGRVFTGTRYAEALLVEGDRVVAVGTEAEVRRARPTGSETHDLAGHLLLPGLIDAHVHIPELARSRASLDARGLGSFDSLLERLREWSREHPRGAVVGGGWEVEQFREGRAPGREVLDRAVPDRPVVLYHTSLHSVSANSVALAAAGIDRSTPDPPNGRIDRDTDGSPTGLLYEDAVRGVASLATAAFPPDPAAFDQILREAIAQGVTTLVSMGVSREENAILRDLALRPGPLPRIRTYLRLRDLERPGPEGPGRSEPSDRFAVVGVKTFSDGAFGPRTAWLSAPYADSSEGESGVPVGTEEELAGRLGRAVELGFAPAVHAIGDRALERATRVLAPLVGRTRAPARIEHAALVPPSLFALLDRVRPVLVVQPGFVRSDHWLASRLGPSRARWAYPFRTLGARGHLLAGSTDAPADPFDPWRSLSAAVGRRDALGRSANPDTAESLPAELAIVLWTRNGGRALGEPQLGTLEPGAPADLVLTGATDAERSVRAGTAGIRETWIAGRPVDLRGTGAR